MVKFFVDPRLLTLLMALALTLSCAALWRLCGQSWRRLSKFVAIAMVWVLCVGAVIQSGATADTWTIDPTSKAGRVTMYDNRGQFDGQKATYAAATAAKTATTAGTGPFFTVCGSVTKTIRVQQVRFHYTVATTAVHADPRLQKTSTPTTLGTAVTLVQVPLDSNSAAGTASLVNFYSALATSGTVVGTIDIQQIWAQVTGTVTAGSQTPMDFTWLAKDEAEAIVLRGATQCMQGSFGTTTTTAPTMTVSVMWTEE